MLAGVGEQLRASVLEAEAIVSGTAEDFSDDEGDDGESRDGKPDIQLGFAGRESNALFSGADWREWDGGKVGGRPVWLDPANLPQPADLACPRCQEPMKFLLQIYCPLDEPAAAFHRALYLFCCRKAACVASGGGSIKCLRNQLGRRNSFYPEDPSVMSQPPPAAAAVAAVLCQVCGCRAPNRCSVCKEASYCSKLHQKSHWRHHKRACNKKPTSEDVSEAGEGAGDVDVENVWLFPEFSLTVEPEEFDDEDLVNAAASTTIWEDAVTAGGRDEEDDAKLTQSDYDKALGSEATDPVYVRFLARVNRGGSEQVLRYSRWRGGPLPISSAVSSSEFLPACCDRCGSERAFEVQIMPQLLHFLHVDRRTKATSSAEVSRQLNEPLEGEALAFDNSLHEDIDWGTIDVYTCMGSCDSTCGEPSHYYPEVVRMQPPMQFRKAP